MVATKQRFTMGAYVRLNIGQIIAVTVLAIATIVFVTVDDAGSMEARLKAINVEPNPKEPAANSPSLTALEAIEGQGGTEDYQTAAAAQAAFTAYLDARKQEYVISSSDAVWFDSNKKEAQLSDDHIPYRFNDINEGMSACAVQVAPDYFAFGRGFGPSSAAYGDDDTGVCADQPPKEKNGITSDGKDRDDCDKTFLSRLFSSDEGFLGITEKSTSDWHKDTCEFQRRAYGGVITAAVLAVVFFCGLVYIVDSRERDFDSLSDNKKRAHRMRMGLASLLFWAAALTLMIIFAQSHHKLHTDNGIKEVTIVPLDDTTTFANIPARATMYDELFSACFGDATDIVAPDALNDGDANGNGRVPDIPAGADRCTTPERFKKAIADLGLTSAGNCKYGSRMAGFYKTTGVCEYPDNFNDVKTHRGPVLRYHDTRQGLAAKGQSERIDVFTLSSDGSEWLIILAVLWGVVVLKQTGVTIGIASGMSMYEFFGCVDDDKFTIAGGYASAL